MSRLTIIGERLTVTTPEIRRALSERDPGPLLLACRQQLEAGADYIDLNIGPAESDGEALMPWAVRLLQTHCDSVPLSLDTTNLKAIEAGLRVCDRSKGRPIVNSADAGDRFSAIALAADYDAIAIALCSAGGIPADNDERLAHCQRLLEEGLSRGMAAEDLWFDPLFLVIRGMQHKQAEVLSAIRMLSDLGLNSTGGVSNVSSGMPEPVRPIVNSCMLSMAMAEGLTSAIVNPNDPRIMETIKTCEIIKNNAVYADAFLTL